MFCIPWTQRRKALINQRKRERERELKGGRESEGERVRNRQPWINSRPTYSHNREGGVGAFFRVCSRKHNTASAIYEQTESIQYISGTVDHASPRSKTKRRLLSPAWPPLFAAVGQGLPTPLKTRGQLSKLLTLFKHPARQTDWSNINDNASMCLFSPPQQYRPPQGAYFRCRTVVLQARQTMSQLR